MTYENKFGMFIHWGVSALTGLQEQAYARYDIPREEYEKLYLEFNPVNYDPEEWVLLAKKAGMKYICFTTKHHDGFCMWDTKYTDYNIMHTPYGRDVLKELADACEKHGMLLSLYYSNPDWHHPDAYNPLSTHQWKAVDKEHGNFEVYKQFIRDQVTELLTNYGKIYTFFWDIPSKIDDPSFNELVRKLQPGIYINDRGWDAGDFSTPEREFDPDAGRRPFERMTEACNAIDSQSWGYRTYADFYSYRHLLSAIDKIMARGGSYLLNVGPKADGSIDPAHAARIKRIGNWYNHMEGTLENHEPDTFDYGIRAPYVAVKKNGKTYLHFHDGLNSIAVSLKNFPNLPKAVRLMNTGEPLDFAIRQLPDDFDGGLSMMKTLSLHIRNIPVDDLAQEPIVLEITW